MKHLFWLLVLCTSLNVLAQNPPVLIKHFYENKPANLQEKYWAVLQENDTLKEGAYSYYFDNGKVWQTGDYKNNQLHGKWLIY